MKQSIILLLAAIGHTTLITQNLLYFEWLSISVAFTFVIGVGYCFGQASAFNLIRERAASMGFKENGLDWALLNGMTREGLGFLPEFLSAASPAPATKQLNDNYSHGGGWRPIKGFTLEKALPDTVLKYPNDPDLKVVAATKCNNQIVLVFQHAFVAVLWPDGKYEVARMD